ncbi:DUF4440 domain-containing protein [Neorhizobium sp. JUb45]|uniref:nuclear transport factor 2 family protein n=1 Tax=unclassified Neorhizobium TaxID=2629175 RepID=UPI001404A8B3|nr:DUF4440 domain-containing protein [Neorhizobium sp. JUb45]
MAGTDLHQHLLALETELQTATTRNSEARLRQLLSSDFREFGRSGRSYDFRQTLAGLTSETIAAKATIEDFSISLLSDTIALATYLGIRFLADGSTQRTNRSSIWRLEADGGWRMVFHQGTPTT